MQKFTVGTAKKSIAASSRAWWFKKTRHPCEGGLPARTLYLDGSLGDASGGRDEQTRPPASPQAGKPTPEDPISPVERLGRFSECWRTAPCCRSARFSAASSARLWSSSPCSAPIEKTAPSVPRPTWTWGRKA
jgi:hypothetical protein